jgi:glutamine synthetase
MATITTNSTERSPSDILARIEEDGVEFVRFWFTDILGQLKSFSVGREEMEEALEQGMGFDGSSITGFNAIEESDMIAMPDPDTYALLPWRTHGDKGNVARLFCDVLRPGGEPYEGDPRFVMRRALQRAKDLGFEHFYIGPELEFFYFRSDELGESGVPEILDKGGYFDLTTLDAGSDLRRDTVNALKAVGIRVEYTHHEVGPSQHEIDMRYAGGLEMSDNAMAYRIVVKEIAAEHGVYATFMPKPLFGENGSGMHTHQSLFTSEGNAFFDGDDQYHLSSTAKSYIAGLLKHAREIAALFAPTVNSYKRLVPGYEAPVYSAWSQRNRSALVRVPMYHPGKEQSTRAELRCPDPSCNPYLTFAAMLHAGLDGIEKGYECPDPMETNLYDLSHDERVERGIEQLPETLGESIDEFAGSDLMRRALGDHIFERYVELKREEWEEYRVQVSRWELERYLPIL